MADGDRSNGGTALAAPRREEERAATLILPTATAKEVLAGLAAFGKVKRDIVRQVGGVTKIGYGQNSRDYVNKIGWLAVAYSFGIDVGATPEQVKWISLPSGDEQVVVSVRATHRKTGATAVAYGVADTAEDFYRKGTRLEKDEEVPAGVAAYFVRAPLWEGRKKVGAEWVRYLPKSRSALVGFAQTRATNRAISTLVGGGENSAEEMLNTAEARASAKTVRPEDEELVREADEMFDPTAESEPAEPATKAETSEKPRGSMFPK